jgi:hypothetical protein
MCEKNVQDKPVHFSPIEKRKDLSIYCSGSKESGQMRD